MNQVTICNMAISRINAKKITAITENNSTPAENCNLFYDPTRRALLREYNWPFAKQDVPLALTANTPRAWDFEYQKPSGCLRVRHLAPESGETLTPTYVGDELVYKATPNSVHKTPYELAGDKIWTNLESAYCVYTEDVTNANLFDDLFTQLFYHRLALAICMPVTGKMALYKAIQGDLAPIQMLAQGISAKTSYVPQDRSGDLVSSRK